MIRTFGFKTLSGSAVPAFGDVLTAAFNGSPNNSGCFSAEVADTSQYQVGDRLVFGAGQSGSNILLINEIVDSTNLLLSSEGDAPLSDWASGTTICLDVSCAQIIVQASSDNSSSLIWIGSDDTVTAAGAGKAFGFVFASGSYQIGNGQWNIARTSDIYVAGASGTKYSAAAFVV